MTKRKRKPCIVPQPNKRRKQGRPSFQELACLPQYASVDTRIQSGINNVRKSETMGCYRKGVKLMWAAAPDEMEAAGVKPMGEYDTLNHHGGMIWGWPSECPLKDFTVKKILTQCIAGGTLTIDQLRLVRKALSYAYMLVHKQVGKNWPCLDMVWETIGTGEKLAPKKRSTLPQVVARPKELKRAFTRGWHPLHPWSLLKFSAGVVAAYDCLVWGGRAGDKGDISRIKTSRDHHWNLKEGWMWTALDGGRCKLPKKIREWKIYMVCFCKSKRHQGPPRHLFRNIDRHGNPTVPISYCTTCPLSALQLKWQFKKAKGRRYAKALPSGKFGRQNDFDVMKLATDWMFAQNAITKRLCHNSGRKSLAEWLGHKRVQASYPEGFELHQDLEGNWRIFYEQELPVNPHKFTRRTQSKDPETCLAALRKLQVYFGVGPEKSPPMGKLGRLLHAVLGETKPVLADRIRKGLPDDPEYDSSDTEPDLQPLDWNFWNGVLQENALPTMPPMLPPMESVIKPENVEPTTVKLEPTEQRSIYGTPVCLPLGKWIKGDGGELLIRF